MPRPVRIAACLLVAAVACSEPREAVPPAECAAAWAADDATAFVQALVSATGSDRPVWPGYTLQDGSYVLNAGPSSSGGVCVGLWQGGRAVSFTSVAEAPTLLTPLYGYYFSPDWHGAPDEPMLEKSTQPASVRAWLEGLDVESAIISPVTIANFPIEMPPVVKVQLAIHEGFHVLVQAPRWYASTGEWPAWDHQPDRAGVQACYTGNPAVESALAAERDTLVQLVNHLLDGDSTAACRAGTAFLAQRAARYDLLTDVHVARHDSTLGSCGEAEALMELEEGTADYASWTVLFDLGQTTRDVLTRRYGAQQSDIFYLTGAMQLHAVELMAPERKQDILRSIIDSPNLNEGSITTTFDRTLRSYCGGPPG